MNKYNVFIDLDSFTYCVEASNEQTAGELAVKAMEEYIAKHLNDAIGIADVVVYDETNFLDDVDIELREDDAEKRRAEVQKRISKDFEGLLSLVKGSRK